VPTRAAKGLDGVELALLHLGGLPTLHDGHALAGVDLVRRDAVPTQVPTALHLQLSTTHPAAPAAASMSWWWGGGGDRVKQ